MKSYVLEHKNKACLCIFFFLLETERDQNRIYDTDPIHVFHLMVSLKPSVLFCGFAFLEPKV